MKTIPYLHCLLAVFAFTGLSLISYSQTVPGIIIRQATAATGRNILDPNNASSPDGFDALGRRYTSKTTAGFGTDDINNSEVPYKPLPAIYSEPYSDLRRGPSHMFSDFVPDANGSSYYMNFDGTNLMFRLRLGSIVSGAKGYSLLIDTDGRFGATGPNADPNYVAATTGNNGNPGFEIEIDLFTQNGSSTGVAVYDVNGTSSPIIRSNRLNYMDFSQVSLSSTNDNGDPDFYLDFYVPFSDLAWSGITTATPLRLVPTTVMAPQPAIGGPKSDIYGLDDAAYGDPNAQYEAFINAMPAATISSWTGNTTTSPVGSVCTAAPAISTVTAGATNTGSVAGTWTKTNIAALSNTATITIIRTANGSTTTIGTITATSGTPWTLQNVTINAGDVITARAQGASESACYTSNAVTATSCTNPANRPATPAISCVTTTKGITGTNKATGWTVWVENMSSGVVDNSVTNTGTIFSPETGTSPAITWMYSSGCTGGRSMPAGSYKVYYTDANGCTSDPVYVCNAGTGQSALGGSLTVPVITAPAGNNFTTATTVISGTADAGSTVILYVNGAVAGRSTVPGNVGTGTGPFSFTGLSLAAGQRIAFGNELNASTLNASRCASQVPGSFTVSCYTSPPVIRTNNNGQLTISQPISGSSLEPAGTAIRVFLSSNTTTPVSTTPVLSNGTWSTANSGTTIGSPTVAGTYNALASSTYFATATSNGCVSGNSASVLSGAGFTGTARCGTITSNTPSGNITSATTAVTISFGASATATTVNLYQDGLLVASQNNLSNVSTVTLDVTGRLYGGNGSTTGILTIGIQETTAPAKEESICPATYYVYSNCTAPAMPNITPASGSTITPGQTITYTFQNPTVNTFYAVADQTSGRELAMGVWANTANDFSITTRPVTSSTTTVIKASMLAPSGEVCTNTATRSITILPLTLLQFKGDKNGNGNVLKWLTATEINTSHFEIERSSDALHFNKIGKVAAMGFSKSSAYNFIDNLPMAGNNYYRLKMVDRDGSFTLSKTIMIKEGTGTNNTLITYPNPFKASIQLNIYLTETGPVTIKLLDARGMQVQVKNMQLTKGTNQVQLTGLTGLAPGLYHIQIDNGKEVLQHKMIKTTE